MKPKYDYFIADDQEAFDPRQHSIHSFSSDWDENHLEYITEDAAEDFFSNHDGWEFTWPLVIVIQRDGKELGRFDVEMETKPVFYARPIKASIAPNRKGE